MQEETEQIKQDRNETMRIEAESLLFLYVHKFRTRRNFDMLNAIYEMKRRRDFLWVFMCFCF